MRRAKFVLNTMVKNESHCIIRMLSSVAPYIDYWVIQDNGSTDGTQDMIRSFFAERKIPGQLYEIEWSGIPGKNRDHALQTCRGIDHGCDWILRVDSDETIQVDSAFDWSVFDDLNAMSFNVLAQQGNCKYYRTWIWNAKLPWHFKHDKRHECIYLEDLGEEFERRSLNESYRHVVYGDGKTWSDPYKFMIDALELERDLLIKDQLHLDRYHLMYTAKSYRDYCCDWRSKFPLGDPYRMEAARRGLFLFERLMQIHHGYPESKPTHIDENCYMVMMFCGELYEALKDEESALRCYLQADPFCPERNEHHVAAARIYRSRSLRLASDNALQSKAQAELFRDRMVLVMSPERRNPFPRFVVFLDTNCYYDSSDQPSKLYAEAVAMTS